MGIKRRFTVLRFGVEHRVEKRFKYTVKKIVLIFSAFKKVLQIIEIVVEPTFFLYKIQKYDSAQKFLHIVTDSLVIVVKSIV